MWFVYGYNEIKSKSIIYIRVGERPNILYYNARNMCTTKELINFMLYWDNFITIKALFRFHLKNSCYQVNNLWWTISTADPLDG